MFAPNKISSAASFEAKQDSQQRAHARVHARQQIALVVSLDSTLLLLVALSLLLSDFDGYDMFVLALHLPHVFTTLIGYIIVHYASGATDVLRMLVLFYLIALVIDIFVAIVRCMFLVHTNNTHQWIAQIVRLVIALVFVFVDIGGALFADIARASAHTFTLTSDQQLQAFAHSFSTDPPASTKQLPV